MRKTQNTGRSSVHLDFLVSVLACMHIPADIFVKFFISNVDSLLNVALIFLVHEV